MAAFTVDAETARSRRCRAPPSRRDSGAADELDAELDLATIVPEERVPPDVVTMRSRVLFEDEGTGRRRRRSAEP